MTHWPAPRTWFEGAGLLLLCMLAVSCTIFEKVKPRYKLQDQPTLVLVDDPQSKLGAPGLANTVATRLAFELEQQEVVSTFISTQELEKLRARMGDSFAGAPIDQIGRELGAQQVLYVWVESAQLEQTGPELFQPKAMVRVKVVDTQGSLLFPQTDPQNLDNVLAITSRGYPLEVALNPVQDNRAGRGQAQVLGLQLSHEIGARVSKLFYAYLPDTFSERQRAQTVPVSPH